MRGIQPPAGSNGRLLPERAPTEAASVSGSPQEKEYGLPMWRGVLMLGIAFNLRMRGRGVRKLEHAELTSANFIHLGEDAGPPGCFGFVGVSRGGVARSATDVRC